MSKIEIVVKKLKFGKTSKFLSKIEIFVKKLKFGKTSKFLSKIEFLVKNRNFGKKSKFWSKIGILVKNLNFLQKPKIWSKIELLVKIEILVNTRNFGQKWKLWSTMEILVKNTLLQNFVLNYNFQFCSVETEAQIVPALPNLIGVQIISGNQVQFHSVTEGSVTALMTANGQIAVLTLPQVRVSWVRPNF